MKARQIIQRPESPIHFISDGGNYPRYTAHCNKDILIGYELVTEGQMQDGDYFQSDISCGNSKYWTQVIGYAGCSISHVWRVCRPIKK